MSNKIITTNDGSHSIFNPKINESYHSKHGAIVEAEHVFIKNGFSMFNKPKIKILEIGFGTGLNALLTYQKTIQKFIHVDYHAIEAYPLSQDYYMNLNFTDLIGLDKSKLLALHNCNWEEKNNISSYFSLTKYNTLIEKYNTDIKFDIIYFDAFSPEKQPELWEIEIFRKMHHFLNNNGFIVTYCAKGIVKRTLKAVGFKIIVLDGPPGKRQMIRGEKYH